MMMKKKGNISIRYEKIYIERNTCTLRLAGGGPGSRKGEEVNPSQHVIQLGE